MTHNTKLKRDSAETGFSLYFKLSSLGNVAPLRRFAGDIQKSLSAFQNDFKPYNPSKKGFHRFGLSLTSRDGGLSGVPDLDSLLEYNKKHKAAFDETDFRTPTPVFKHCKALQNLTQPFLPYMGRSHILRLDRGGFFPPHRDLSPSSFRLFVSLSPSSHYAFILDNIQLRLKTNQLYFINTRLSHSLFSYCDGSLFVVFNIDLVSQAVRAVLSNLEIS